MEQASIRLRNLVVEFSRQTGLSLRETSVCRGSKVSSRCLRSLSRSFCGVLASVELLKNGGGFTTLSKVPVPSDHKSLTTNLQCADTSCASGTSLPRTPHFAKRASTSGSILSAASMSALAARRSRSQGEERQACGRACCDPAQWHRPDIRYGKIIRLYLLSGL